MAAYPRMHACILLSPACSAGIHLGATHLFRPGLWLPPMRFSIRAHASVPPAWACTREFGLQALWNRGLSARLVHLPHLLQPRRRFAPKASLGYIIRRPVGVAAGACQSKGSGVGDATPHAPTSQILRQPARSPYTWIDCRDSAFCSFGRLAAQRREIAGGMFRCGHSRNTVDHRIYIA